VLIGVVVLALAGVALVLVSRDDGEPTALTDRSAPADLDEPVATTRGATVPDTEARTTVPAPQLRVPVEAEGLAWTMVATPATTELQQTLPGGSPVNARLWSADRTSPAEGGDIVIILDLEGRSYDLEVGLRGAIAQNNGQVIDGPSAVTLGGRSGQMMTGTLVQAGRSGYIRVAGAEFGDRVVIVGVASVTDDPDLDQQAFADLVASVREG
jgi:hypothetical protein